MKSRKKIMWSLVIMMIYGLISMITMQVLRTDYVHFPLTGNEANDRHMLLAMAGTALAIFGFMVGYFSSYLDRPATK